MGLVMAEVSDYFLFFLVVSVGVVVWFDKYNRFLISYLYDFVILFWEWVVWFVLLFSLILFVVILVSYFVLYRRRVSCRLEYEGRFLSLLRKVNCFSELDELCNDYSSLVGKFGFEVNEVRGKIEKDIREAELVRENEVRRKREMKLLEEQKKLEEKDKQDDMVVQLFNYYVEKKGVHFTPTFAIDYPDHIVSMAKQEYKTFDSDGKLKEQVITHILKNNSLPGNFHSLSSDEQELYREYIIWEKFDLHKELGHPIGERFFIASEVEPLERERLLGLGFRNVPFNNPKTGKLGLNFLVWNDTCKESDYHFCLKHWFAKEFGGEIEKLVDDVRVDVVINDIALEIETGTNKEIQVQKKIKVLEENFSEWYIICSRGDKKKYSRFVSKDRILTMTEVYNKLSPRLGK